VETIYYLVFVRGFRALARRLAGPDPGAAKPVGDPVGRAPVLAAVRLMRVFVSALDPDHVDAVWMKTAALMPVFWSKSRRLQAGLLRNQALSLALGFTGLLLFAWGATWR
jgi:NADH-quinone oxidoreductase subunit L